MMRIPQVQPAFPTKISGKDLASNRREEYAFHVEGTRCYFACAAIAEMQGPADLHIKIDIQSSRVGEVIRACAALPTFLNQGLG